MATPDERERETGSLRAYLAAMRPIPEGTFTMGDDCSRETDEQPAHRVTVSGFRMGATPVTVGMWKEYAASELGGRMPPEPNPVGFEGARKFNIGWRDLDHPIVNVNWDECRAYCAWASEMSGIALDLPSEAQWEYAARGGSAGKEYPWGDVWDAAKVWCSKEKLGDRGGTGSVNRTERIWRDHPFGLLDMAGNVWEWCLDWYDPEWYGRPQDTGLDVVNRDSSPTQKVAYVDGSVRQEACRCLRGGSWGSNALAFFRCAYRGRFQPDFRFNDFGFRLSAGPA